MQYRTVAVYHPSADILLPLDTQLAPLSRANRTSAASGLIAQGRTRRKDWGTKSSGLGGWAAVVTYLLYAANYAKSSYPLTAYTVKLYPLDEHG